MSAIGRALRWIVGVVGELMITVGIFFLLFVAWQLWWTDVEANAAQSTTVEQLDALFAKPAAPVTAKGLPSRLLTGDAFAVVHIPRFGADYARPVLEGTDTETLRRGLGHYPASVGPGAVGNFAMAGHRTTWGRPLHEIDTLVAGDRVVVETATGWFVYAVESHEIVAPTQVSVVAPVPDHPEQTPTRRMLTFTACHPKYSAEQRYVVHAVLETSFTRAQGLPAEYLTVPIKAG